MTQPIDHALAIAAQRLDRADAALTLLVSHNRSRNFWMSLFSILTIIFLCFYLSYAYMRYGNEVTPDLVAKNAQAVFQNQLPSAKQQLETNLKANAPKYVDKVLDQADALPGTYADQLNQQASDATDKAMPQVSSQLYDELKHSLDEAKQSKSSGTDEQRFQSTLTAISQVYADETLKFVNQAHDTYASQAVDFTNYLERLAQNKDLDRREQLHRDMFKNLMLLMRERAKENGGNQLKLNVLAPS